ncbi:MAG TPA: hypothetical protein VF844_02270 [Ktedonobacteraceae bacterium]
MSAGVSMRLHRLYSKGCHCYKVAKAAPDLSRDPVEEDGYAFLLPSQAKAWYNTSNGTRTV